MTIKRQVRRLVEKLTNTHIYRGAFPRGIDLFQDITYHLPMMHVDVVFDVGANVGQSAMQFLKWFPESQIYCFEPVGDTFRQLQSAIKGYDRVHAFQLALGAAPAKGTILRQGPSDEFRLLNPSEVSSAIDPSSLETVEVETLDAFCRARNLDRIGYLKIDTEGGDLEVLKGAEDALSSHRIDLVQVEAGMNPRNKRHVPFEALKGFLESKGYFLFGIYEQVGEWPTQEPNLRRTNCVFISEPAIEANRHPVNAGG